MRRQPKSEDQKAEQDPERRRWLDSLGKGNSFAIYREGKLVGQGMVARITQKWIVDTEKRRWRRSDGWRYGSQAWSYVYRICPMTDDAFNYLEHDRLLLEVKHAVRVLRHDDIEQATLAEVAGLLGVR